MRTLHINGMTPPALAIAIALKEKKLDFHIVDVDWRQTPAAFSSFSDSLEIPATLEGEFPILVDDGMALSDSYFVLEYIDDAYPAPSLRPDAAYGQWQLQALARFFGERALPAVSSIGVSQHFSGVVSTHEVSILFAGAASLTSERRNAWIAASQPQDVALIEESQRKIGLLFHRLDGLLSDGRPWLLGQDYTLSDIAAFVLVHPFLDGQLDRGDLVISEAVASWRQRVAGRPAVDAALALREPAFLPGPEHARWG